MSIFRPAAIALAASSIWLNGCGPARLNESRELSLDSNIQARGLDLPAQSKPQTLTLEFKSSGGEVSVYVFKEEDCKTDDDLLTASAKKALASKINSKGDTFTVEVPANTPARVAVRGGGRTLNVNLHVSNQK